MYHSGNQLIDPQLLFGKTHLQPGMHVANFGCGRTGHLVFPAAMIIGERGVVYAVDILKDVLEIIRKRSELDGLHNVHTVWADVERTGHTAIPPRTLDVVFMVNLLIHIKNRPAVLAEAARLLKPKGRILVVDWVDTSVFKLPSTNLINFSAVAGWAGENNFVVQEEFEAGKYHQGLVLYRHD